MKNNNIKDFRTKKKEELGKMIYDLKKELSKLLVDRSVGKLKNIAIIGIKRKEIARIFTLLKEKELAEL